MNSPLAAVSKLLDIYAKKHPALISKAAVGESDLGDGVGSFREDVSPTLKTASVIDFLLANGATPVPPMVRMLVMGQPAVPAWRGNGQALRVSKLDLNGTALEVYSIGALAVATKETLEDTSDATKTAFTKNLTDAIDGGVNSVAMDPTNGGVAGVLPPALTYGATTIHSAGATILNIATDFNAGLRELSDKGSDLRNVVAIVHSRTAANLATMRTAEGGAPFPGMTPSGGVLFGVPTFASAAVPNGGSPTDTTVTLIDATDICIADLGARPSFSNETMIEMSDSPTGDAVTPAAATATRVSMFQAEATAVKVVRRVNWALRRGLVVAVDGVDYQGAREMRILGFTITREKQAPRALQSVDSDRGWTTIGHYSPWQLTQGFQLDIEHRSLRGLQRNHVVFACQSLIASDISKLRLSLLEERGGIWQETRSAPYDALLRSPNQFQTWQQFVERWGLSKQSHGNAFILLERDEATRVRAMHVLDPERVTPLVAESGDVYYRLQADDLAGVPDGDAVVPASEIMHDRFNCLFHPLVGLSPLYAAGLAATQGLEIQEQSTRFFSNAARPGGILTSAQVIPDEIAQKYKTRWEQNYTGENRGRTAVLGSGLDYKPIAENAVDSELVAQLKMSAEMICTAYLVPAYKVGVGAMPTYQNAEVLNQIYYDQCLQRLIEAIEALIDAGLGLANVGGRRLRAQFDLDGLLRMDSRTKIAAMAEAVKAGIMAPNEGRARLSLPPVKGGESPYLQQQNFSLAALAKRDALMDPFATVPAPTPTVPDPEPEKNATLQVRRYHKPDGHTQWGVIQKDGIEEHMSDAVFWREYSDRILDIEDIDDE